MTEEALRRDIEAATPVPPRAEALVPSGWPELHAEALHGPAGDFVDLLDPHTEADKAAILGTALVMFGNAVGRGPHFKAESDKHYTNTNIVLVGETSKGRKGTSAGRVRGLLRSVDPEWEKDASSKGCLLVRG